MFNPKRFATLAVIAALVPAFGASAAQASVPRDPQPIPLELCHIKWILGPQMQSVFETSADTRPTTPEDEHFDVEQQTSDGSDPLGYDTVAVDDPTYDGC